MFIAAIIFFIFTVIAGILGFTGLLAAAFVSVIKIFFFIFLLVFIVTFILGIKASNKVKEEINDK